LDGAGADKVKERTKEGLREKGESVGEDLSFVEDVGWGLRFHLSRKEEEAPRSL